MSVFTQGCLHHCPWLSGNPDSHAIDGGYIEDTEQCLLEIDQESIAGWCDSIWWRTFLQATAYSFCTEG